MKTILIAIAILVSGLNSYAADKSYVCGLSTKQSDAYDDCMASNAPTDLIMACSASTSYEESFAACINSGLRPDQAEACSYGTDFAGAYKSCLAIAKEKNLGWQVIKSCESMTDSSFLKCLALQ